MRFYLGLLLAWTAQRDQALVEFKRAYALGPTTELGQGASEVDGPERSSGGHGWHSNRAGTEEPVFSRPLSARALPISRCERFERPCSSQ